MTRRSVKCVVFMCLFGFIATEIEQNKDICFCLSEEINGLRNPIHIEPVTENGDKVYLIGEQIGVVYLYKGGKLSPYIDISQRVTVESSQYDERGLLGFAAHPNFEENKKLYTYSIRTVGGSDYAVVTEITGGDLESEKDLLYIQQPGKLQNGGQMLFGKLDGYLYIFVGDGNPSSYANIQAQNGSSLLGKVLRIDVDKKIVYDDKLQYYSIPHDNPKRGDWKPEVYAIGLRNSWRCSQDNGDEKGKLKGRIFCGDLGDGSSDEINLIEKEANYGWPLKEGYNCTHLSEAKCQALVNDKLPLMAFGRKKDEAKALVAGPLYRGTELGDLYGKLLVGDVFGGALKFLREENDIWKDTDLPVCNKERCGCDAREVLSSALLSFGQTHDGEPFLLMIDDVTFAPGSNKGRLLRMRPPLTSTHVTCGSRSFTASTTMMLFTILLWLYK
ncbi:HHIP-like protein 1 [Mya arenaria]|uniref:HHIP-like protein 1 n=1 Tax=Mya arenaria TaxID=6604 RepID=UPI0022E7E457|nr:HHIP-like protein 1 [Mya arenaria]